MRKSKLNKYINKEVIITLKYSGVYLGVLKEGMLIGNGKSNNDKDWFNIQEKTRGISFRAYQVIEVELI